MKSIFQLILLSLLCTLPAQAANRVALLIGNQNYKNDKPLRNPQRDVNLIERALRDVGFTVMVRNDVSKKSVIEALRSLQNGLQPGDVGLIYYSGHGLQYNSDNYLVPVDANIVAANEIPYEGLSTQRLLSYMNNAATRIVILDACRNNPYQIGTKSIGKGMARQDLSQSQNTLIAFAAAPNQEALDGDGSNSPYAEALAESIKQPGLSIESVFKTVRKKVKQQTDNKQEPWYNASMENEFFFVAKHGGNDTSPPAANPQAEVVFWESIKNETRPEFFETYLKSYPNGIYVNLAKLKLHSGGRAEIDASNRESMIVQLTVKTSPPNAVVRILNIAPEYHEGMELKPGKYHLEVTAPGYQRHTEWVEVTAGRSVHSVALRDAVPSQATVTEAPSVNTNNTPMSFGTFAEPGIEMIPIEPGCFQMGSPDSEEGHGHDEAQHDVCLSRGYYLGKYEVTQGQWRAVMGYNPSKFKDCGDDCPVEQVSWNDVQDFIGKLNRQTGLNYRLPSEAEWEYAARAGTTTPFAFGDTITPAQVNYDGTFPYSGASKGLYRRTPVKVGSLPANAWGLHEMHGNVWEWVQDYWRGKYPSGSATDPAGPEQSSFRAARGGSWSHRAKDVRSAARGHRSPGAHIHNLGFRLARSR